jgi:hypothetical protein
MENKLLRKVKKAFPNYFIYFKEDNVLVLSQDKTLLPFAYIIVDEAFPHHLLISFNIEFPLATEAAEIVLKVNDIQRVKMVEEFFISSNGSTMWGDQARDHFDLESSDILEQIEPISDLPN